MSGPGASDNGLLDLLPTPFEPDDAYIAFADWAASRGTPLYPAQDESVIELVTGANLILATPTGTGKSLVAIAAHAFALAQGQRTYYTAPIKALVSEKFFQLAEVFGAERVGMVTGDSSVNPDAPLICCTAEILANVALRQGADAPVDQVVMDEFHFYGDPERGWAWQVPLITLPRAQFVLLSATLGDVTEIRADLTRRTGRPTALIEGALRPVPLSFEYCTAQIHEEIEELLNTRQAPVYIVHFSQAAALEQAQALSSLRLLSREGRDEIAVAIGGFRFTTGFGTTLSRLVRAGIGVHHAGMLPRYRRLVETLAQRGLLKVICGTDTLGVGINVPIRTVLLTALTKYDGSRMRQLSAREFHQISGRAGRAGFDTAGTVVALAPEHEIDYVAALKKAGDDVKKQKRIVRKKPAAGFVSWGSATLERLIAAAPEPLVPRLQLTSAMLINVIARGGDVATNIAALVFDNHEPRARRFELARRALSILRTLRDAEIVVITPAPEHPLGVALAVTVDLQANFALNQPLSPFALAAIDLLDPSDAPGGVATGHYPLDVVSIIEATLDDPRPVLMQQEHAARGEAVAAMKADGIEYDERMALLEDITYPKPLGDLLAQTFEIFATSQPWVRDFELRPKSVVRDLYEKSMSFTEYVSNAQLTRSEGVLLRYLSDAFRALRQTVPESAKTEELRDLIEWLGELVRQVDSSLVDEWSALVNPAALTASDAPVVPPAPPSVVTNRRAFTVLVRNELFRRVLLAAQQRDDELIELDPDAGWPDALDAYYDEHPAPARGSSIGVDGAARSPRLCTIDESAAATGTWNVEQIISDPCANHDWRITAAVDLAASAEAGAAVLRAVRMHRL
ncbi:MAG TPA: DUF3516 domain-containing protein [Candidatus Lumbricidophila sp.]|nr:DUF3516 domain-containing protein [Candidatus Lumbricidophila sp.]